MDRWYHLDKAKQSNMCVLRNMLHVVVYKTSIGYLRGYFFLAAIMGQIYWYQNRLCNFLQFIATCYNVLFLFMNTDGGKASCNVCHWQWTGYVVRQYQDTSQSHGIAIWDIISKGGGVGWCGVWGGVVVGCGCGVWVCGCGVWGCGGVGV